MIPVQHSHQSSQLGTGHLQIRIDPQLDSVQGCFEAVLLSTAQIDVFNCESRHHFLYPFMNCPH